MFLSGTASGAEVTLAWDAANGADGYRIYYGTDIDGLNYSVDTGQLVEFTVSDLRCNTNYFFNVRSYNENGMSAPTNTVSELTANCPALPDVGPNWEIDSLTIVPVN